MYRFVEAEEFGLPEIAEKLGRAIDPGLVELNTIGAAS